MGAARPSRARDPRASSPVRTGAASPAERLLAKQACRLRWAAQGAMRAGAVPFAAWPREATCALAAYWREGGTEDLDADFLGRLTSGSLVGSLAAVPLQAAADRAARRVAEAEGRRRRQAAADARAAMAADRARKYRRTRPPAYPPLAFMARADGSVAADPGEVDDIFAGAWAEYFDRPVDAPELIDQFLGSYGRWVHAGPVHRLQPLTGAALEAVIAGWPATAAGLDGFSPADARLLSPRALEWIAKILNAVELGAPWPDAAGWAWLAPAAKPDEDHTRPEGFRLLAVLAFVYRLWAKARLADLMPWVSSWAPSSFYTCVKGRGAADAWLLHAAALERAIAEGRDFTGGAVDIEKCYDMLVRPLAYVLAQRAGIDPLVLGAYVRFQESLMFSVRYAGGFGAFRPHRRGIPQGCPLSQLFLGLVALVWQRRVAGLGMDTRVLADDFRFTAEGPEQGYAVAELLRISCAFVDAMGGRVKVPKCLAYSSAPAVRRDLRRPARGDGGATRPHCGRVSRLGRPCRCHSEGLCWYAQPSLLRGGGRAERRGLPPPGLRAAAGVHEGQSPPHGALRRRGRPAGLGCPLRPDGGCH